MRRFVRLLRDVPKEGFIFAALTFTGCGGGNPLAQPPLSMGPQLRERPVAQAQIVNRGFAVAEEGSTVVRIYPLNNKKNGPPLCTVPGSMVQDITSDEAGDVYVPNGNGTVVEYAPGCGAAIAHWHEGEGQPDDVAVFGKTVYVGTLGTGEKAGDIAVCTTSCNGVLNHPSIWLLYGIAVDARGNVWAAVSGKNATLIVWPGGKMPGHIVKGYKNPNSTGLDFANDGTLIAIDPFALYAYTYSCDANADSCRELGRWRLHYGGFFGKLDEANAQFQVSNNGTGAVDVYKYPGFAYQYSYNNGLSVNANVDGITAFPI